MFLGRIVGSVWATRKQEALEGARFVMLQPVDTDRSPAGDPVAALDTVGAGLGELVYYITSYEAAIPWLERHPHLDLAGVDAAVVGIVDHIEEDGDLAEKEDVVS